MNANQKDLIQDHETKLSKVGIFMTRTVVSRN